MKRKHHTLLLLAGAGVAYYFYQKSQAPAVVAVPTGVAAAVPGVAGFGYFPSGADRPFARAYGMPGANLPFARASHGVRWY